MAMLRITRTMLIRSITTTIMLRAAISSSIIRAIWLRAATFVKVLMNVLYVVIPRVNRLKWLPAVTLDLIPHVAAMALLVRAILSVRFVN